MPICQNFMELQALDGAPHRFSKMTIFHRFSKGGAVTNFNLAKLGSLDRRAIHTHGRMRPFADENAIKPRALSTNSPVKCNPLRIFATRQTRQRLAADTRNAAHKKEHGLLRMWPSIITSKNETQAELTRHVVCGMTWTFEKPRQTLI